MIIIDLTWRVDLQTADKAKENLEKAKGGHLGTHFAGVRNGKEHTPTDQICADRGTFIVENVCNLAAVLNGNKSAHFKAGTYPVNFVGMTGLPCRVVARV